MSHCVSDNNDAEEESDEDEDYVPSEDWKKVRKNVRHLCCPITFTDGFMTFEKYTVLTVEILYWTSETE